MKIARWTAGALLALVVGGAHAALDPEEGAERWWDASRADRIGYSDRAASRCKSSNCDSLQLRSCLNETLKPPVALSVHGKSLSEVTATCIAGFKARP